jgi:hypothetical protein
MSTSRSLAPIAWAALLFGFGCGKSASGTTSTSTTVPAVYSKIYGATSITSDGTWITIKSTGLPDHVSCYYPTSNALYQAYPGTTTFDNYTFSKNPNTIAAQSYTFKIPLNPTEASTHAATPLGPIGVSLNGVPFYNQYNGSDNPLTVEIASFDQGWGHPDQGSHYHYHVEPVKLTAAKGEDALLGFLLDGFPVYGPYENGALVPASSLDEYHGHTTATADYPNGIYHYHISASAPYINGDGFYGTAGTVSQ